MQIGAIFSVNENILMESSNNNLDNNSSVIAPNRNTSSSALKNKMEANNKKGQSGRQ
jgi:hypothetical protein